MGVQEGTQIAFVGYTYSAYWARLARLRVVVEIRPEDAERFFGVDHVTRSHVLDLIRNAGAKIIIAEPLVTGPIPPGWVEVQSTGYIARFL
jgi:hypothetical protein